MMQKSSAQTEDCARPGGGRSLLVLGKDAFADVTCGTAQRSSSRHYPHGQRDAIVALATGNRRQAMTILTKTFTAFAFATAVLAAVPASADPGGGCGGS